MEVKKLKLVCGHYVFVSESAQKSYLHGVPAIVFGCGKCKIGAYLSYADYLKNVRDPRSAKIWK